MTGEQGPVVDEPVDYVARVAGDRALLEHLRAARAWGVPPSTFLGRPVVVEYVLDEHGRTRRTVAVEWTDDDRGYAVALLAVEASTCRSCGHDLAESTDPTAEDGYAVDVKRCHACTAIAVEANAYAQNPHPQALQYAARRRRPTTPEPTEGPTDDPHVDAG